MTAKVVCAAVMIVLLFGIAPPASADFTVVFPDGSQGIELNLGFGLHAAVFWDIPGDFDIFTFHANAVGGPLLATLIGGFPSGIAYWLNFVGTDQFGRLVYDVFVKNSLGGGFFFVGQIAF